MIVRGRVVAEFASADGRREVIRPFLLPGWLVPKAAACLHRRLIIINADRARVWGVRTWRAIVSHEFVHVLQQRRLGWWRFVARYLWEMVRYGYLGSPLEQEAYRAQEGIASGLGTHPFRLVRLELEKTR